ncbi:hypothetical protein SapgrDRAFT_2291 [Saprospira grandis DSM 2844]|uniref:Uncharacterized protein n=1 Tax=Saprospira grandis DSM 2844 TaxID=694433 RepID=J0P2D2_9BACT|nr:hypothetical protein SapgrDRAFT_2291 [Saprospira grandis DSM 2844]
MAEGQTAQRCGGLAAGQTEFFEQSEKSDNKDFSPQFDDRRE